MATLLVVDDDNMIRETLHDFFLSNHDECHTADRAEQALAFLEFESYDAILTDIDMPGLSGRELLHRVKEDHPTTPVIVISGIASVEEAGALIEMGAFAYFTKPFKLEEIEAAVNKAVAHHRELSRAHEPEVQNDEPENAPSSNSAE